MVDGAEKKYLVRTLYLSNFAEAAIQVAEQRRSPTDVDALRNALKKLEIADKTLEKELNAYASQDCELVGFLRHDLEEYPLDLLLTAIFVRSGSDESDDKV
jgi:hypothetical protein